MLIRALFYAIASLGATSAFAPYCVADELSAYVARTPVQGTIRIWGSPADRTLIEQLAAGFRRVQPGIDFSYTLHGPESTFAGVYTGVADIAFMARELRVPMESMAFEWVHHYKAFEVEIANAGSEPERPCVNLAVLVHRDNPLTHLTLKQLDGIFGAEHLRGGTNIRRWGEVVAGNGWEQRPIHVYGPELDGVSALFIRHAVLNDSRKWNPGYREIGAGWSKLLASLARDPDGIAYAPVLRGNERVKPIELAADEGGPFSALTTETVAARTYPLSRVITVALDRKPGTPIDSKAKEFVRYILSREGQEAIARDGAYVPLSLPSVRRQLERLE